MFLNVPLVGIKHYRPPPRGCPWGCRGGRFPVDYIIDYATDAINGCNGILYSAAVRRAVWSYYQDKCFIMPDSSPAPGAGAAAPDSRKDAPALEG